MCTHLQREGCLQPSLPIPTKSLGGCRLLQLSLDHTPLGQHPWDSGTYREGLIPMVTRLVSMLSSSPRIRKHTLFNMLAAFKKIILKTHTSSKTRRCIYLELLSKSNMRNNKKVALEYSLHKHQHEPEKGMQTATSQPRGGGEGGRERQVSLHQGERQTTTTNNKDHLFYGGGKRMI